MLACLRTASLFGVEASPVQVEVDVSFGMPGFTMVGLPDASVRESRDRVKSAIRNSGFDFPPHRITVNLSPADLPKVGASFDLPIALGILAAQGTVERRDISDIIVVGELSLDGSIQTVRGVLPIAVAARRAGSTAILLPAANATEAAVVDRLFVLGVATLTQAVAAINHPESAGSDIAHPPVAVTAVPDLRDVRGQLLARRALEIAAAGAHNLLFVGPPGAGKTMMARRLPGILPPLTFDEALEVSAVHSVAGLLPPGAALLSARPFRAPHHTVSSAALVGGGSHPRPGEISLAHHGVLFLDEMLEFHRHVLDLLRQPLEEGTIAIARAARRAIFPARFLLLAAMNPCPCGFAGDPARPCRCTPTQLTRYRGRLSGPLLDRLDLTVEVPAVPPDALVSNAPGESSREVAVRVAAARRLQDERLAGERIRTNAELSPAMLARWCELNAPALRTLSTAAKRLGLTARGYDRVRRVARTIADLAAHEEVEPEDVAEALQFRMPA